MATKTITVTDDAYQLLKQQKRPGESFSQTIRRAFGGGSARALVGLMTPEDAENVRQDLQQRRQRRALRAKSRSEYTSPPTERHS